MNGRWFYGILACMLLTGPALAETKPLKLGVLSDMSSVYAEAAGMGSVTAVQLGIEDAGGKAFGMPVELISADFQLKTDVALSIAREWFDRGGVDAIFDVINSGTALAVNNLAKEEKKLVFVGAAAADAIGGADCNGYGIGWLYNMTSIVRTVVTAQIAHGYTSWFLLEPDGAYGTLMDGLIKKYVVAGGGKVIGAARFPYETQDFSSYLIQAQTSGAKLIVSTSGGTPNINVMKQSREFGLPNNQQAVGGMIDILTDVKAAGLNVMNGQTYATSFYWNFDDRTRDFAERFYAKMGKMPTNNQAASYSSALWFIRAVNATGSRDPETVLAWLRNQTIDDLTTRNGKLRKGGRLVRDMYLVQAKSASEATGPWDFYNVLEKIPGAQAFDSDASSGCPMDQ
jgi:branched-chain amino acid transport system substrate-binding protein